MQFTIERLAGKIALCLPTGFGDFSAEEKNSPNKMPLLIPPFCSPFTLRNVLLTNVFLSAAAIDFCRRINSKIFNKS
jgi:hypothetical protein